ncbi:MAG: class I SAM-dependent methyltransferase [Promethearchaeota archaeon]|jgi:ubiquinone/menaquinone biosynthesis C-methylase UbiE
MTEEILEELDADGLRSVFLKYIREGFENIPAMDKPQILEIGCGTGIPTLELARLSNGEITGVDIDEEALVKLKLKIKEKDLSSRIKVYNRSVYETKFDDETFDIIWEEGVLHLLDLKKALKECKRVLKLNGFMVTGETTNWSKRKLKHFPRFGFKLIKEIPWEKNCWWTEYYAPLEEKINILRKKYNNLDDNEEIKRHIMEIEMIKKDPSGFDCVTYILQKIE